MGAKSPAWASSQRENIQWSVFPPVALSAVTWLMVMRSTFSAAGCSASTAPTVPFPPPAPPCLPPPFCFSHSVLNQHSFALCPGRPHQWQDGRHSSLPFSPFSSLPLLLPPFFPPPLPFLPSPFLPLPLPFSSFAPLVEYTSDIHRCGTAGVFCAPSQPCGEYRLHLLLHQRIGIQPACVEGEVLLDFLWADHGLEYCHLDLLVHRGL